MSAVTQLQRQYAEKSVHLAGETLLPLGEAIRFVQDCQSLSIPIIGMELFERVDDGITPVGLADYSQASRMNDCVEATTTSALALLTGQLSKKMLIVFTVGEAVSLA